MVAPLLARLKDFQSNASNENNSWMEEWNDYVYHHSAFVNSVLSLRGIKPDFPDFDEVDPVEGFEVPLGPKMSNMTGPDRYKGKLYVPIIKQSIFN